MIEEEVIFRMQQEREFIHNHLEVKTTCLGHILRNEKYSIYDERESLRGKLSVKYYGLKNIYIQRR